MIGLVVVALSLAILTVLPWVIAHGLEGRASPKVLASMHLLTLIGLAVLPIGWLACIAGGIGDALRSKSTLSIICWTTSGGFNVWRISVELLSMLLLARLIWVGTRVFRATKQLGAQGVGLSSAHRAITQYGPKVVTISSGEPVAFATGIVRSRAIISTGLLELLEPSEQRAVVEHELAHLRLGHPRILFFASIIALAYSWLPPVHWAMSGLRRELEASADDQAAATCGSKPLILALAKVGIEKGSRHLASFADADTLRYRIRRLESGNTNSSKGFFVGVGLVLLLVITLSLSICGLFSSIQAANAELGCILGIGALALYVLRPLGEPEGRDSV